MALFYVGYVIAVASTVAFILAILTPKWISPANLPAGATYPAYSNGTSYRGIFYVDEGQASGGCRDWILIYKDSVANCRQQYAVACAALAIVGSSLSIILLWLAGGYLYVRRRRLAPHFVTFIAALTLLIFFISIVIWIVMITMNRDGNRTIPRQNIGFSTWIAVGSSGGYLIAFILFILYRIDLGHRRYLKEMDMHSRRF